jgi:hypothetical protein
MTEMGSGIAPSRSRQARLTVALEADPEAMVGRLLEGLRPAFNRLIGDPAELAEL